MQAKTTPALGDYAKRDFQQQPEELQRLKLQATIALEQERNAWRAAGLRPGMTVLDLGCGPGFTSCELARFVGPAGTVTGVDVNPGLLDIAGQAKTSEQVDNVAFATANLYNLALSPASFDFAYARFVFQHLTDPGRALQQVRRCLKPGGILCVLDIDDSWTSFSPATRAMQRFVRQSGQAQLRSRGNRAIGSCLYGLLRQAGFEDVQTTIVPLTSTSIGLEAFLGLAVMFRLALLGKWRRLLALPLLHQIRRAAKHPDAWGAVGIFVTSGRTPPEQ